MIYFICASIVIVAFAVGMATGYSLHKKYSLCDSCEYLKRKGGGGYFKYKCGYEGFFDNDFDKPPEYCKYYKRREEND